MVARREAPRRLLAALAVVVLAAVAPAGVLTPAARAVILPAQTIDGPSEDIVSFGGVAMAEDGTGGLVYLKRVEGVPHVFVSRFVEGRWQAPVRVDNEEPYAASWPRIGAADGGELIVVWATPFATSSKGKQLYELLGSLLGPGGERFGQAMIIDGNVQEATGMSPALAVSSTGQADVVYRVVEPGEARIPLLRPGDVAEKVRLAHFNGDRWSNLGTINRNPGVSMRPPTSENAPQIAIGPTGNGLVVWQEPEIEGVARIWARRFFGSSLNYVMPVSTPTFGGAPIPNDADAPAVAMTRFGQAEVAYRQVAGNGSPLPGPRIFLNKLPDGESENGAEFVGSAVADEAVPGGRAAVIGPPSIDLDERLSLRLIYDDGGTPRVVEGNDKGLSGTVNLGPRFAGAEASAVSVMNPEGGGVSAWPSADGQGHPAVAVREDFPEGAVQTGLVSGGAGGEVAELAVGRSGLGDGLVGFRQGQLGEAAIVASQVSAPPAAPLVTVPKEWVRPAHVSVSWQPPASADGPLHYEVVLDGRIALDAGSALSSRIGPRGLGSGVHRLQVLAIDRDGASTLSAPAKLMIDATIPSVAIRTLGATVSVRVRDRFSGAVTRVTLVRFGDGRVARGRAGFNHRYARPGRYQVEVRVRSRAGNAGVVRRWVRVR